MKRTSFFIGIALIAFVIFSQTGTQAVNVTFDQRFAGDTKMGDSGTYNFDKAHTFIGFRVGHNGLIEVPGFFRDFTGSVSFDSKDVSKSTVEFTAKATSIDTGVAGRDNHLRTADFFDVAKFPDLIFKSTKVAKKGKNWLVTGDLSMKGVTKSITFPFNIAGFLPATDRNGGRMGITAETMINRRDFGVNYDSKIPGTNLQVVSDQVKVVLQIEAVKPKDAAK
ncbi:MAG: YceI family protein [Pyrinomonadaceae bacterium]